MKKIVAIWFVITIGCLLIIILGGSLMVFAHRIAKMNATIVKLKAEIHQHHLAWDVINSGYDGRAVVPKRVLYPDGPNDHVRDWEFPKGLLVIETADGWHYIVDPDEVTAFAPLGSLGGDR
ncbi:MAG: hypothetical protein AAB604_01145 [Patescibacteria group bacterium]